ncbi:hypothetical protein DFH09DRAFT_172018 [Mycena vulgaris]|nr:hypothetical protein DFH09DRAFT_172018 [Mycena vulgaris]
MTTAARQSKPAKKGAPEPARRQPAWTGARAPSIFSPAKNPPNPSQAAPASFPSAQDKVLQSLAGLTGTTITLLTKTAQRYEGVIAATSSQGDTPGATLRDVKEITNPGGPPKDLFIASTNIDTWTSGPADTKVPNGDSFQTDTDVSEKKPASREREPQAWQPSSDGRPNPQSGGGGGDETFGAASKGQWDQLKPSQTPSKSPFPAPSGSKAYDLVADFSEFVTDLIQWLEDHTQWLKDHNQRDALIVAAVSPQTNPFFGSQLIKTTAAHVTADFNPFKNDKVVEASQVSPIWPYKKKTYVECSVHSSVDARLGEAAIPFPLITTSKSLPVLVAVDSDRRTAHSFPKLPKNSLVVQRYQVVVDRVPASFNLTLRRAALELHSHNPHAISHPSVITEIRWLKPKAHRDPNTKTGSLLLTLSDPISASLITSQGLVIEASICFSHRYEEPPRQCYNCQGYGHAQHQCVKPDSEI